jgi:hypothetical protein
MGIRTDPGYKLYVSDCACFLPGETPKKLYLSIADIQKGQYWVEGMPEPANGTFIVEWASPCYWESLLPPPPKKVYLGPYGSEVLLPYVFPNEMYYSGDENPCVFRGVSGITSPGFYFYGGIHVITCRPPSLPFAIQQTCLDVGVDAAEQTFAEISPAADLSLITRLARVQDSTCIYVKRDTTYTPP